MEALVLQKSFDFLSGLVSSGNLLGFPFQFDGSSGAGGLFAGASNLGNGHDHFPVDGAFGLALNNAGKVIQLSLISNLVAGWEGMQNGNPGQENQF